MKLLKIAFVAFFAVVIAGFSAHATATKKPTTSWLLIIYGDNSQASFVIFTEAFAGGIAALDDGFYFDTKKACQDAGKSMVSSILETPQFQGNTYRVTCASISDKDALVIDNKNITKK